MACLPPFLPRKALVEQCQDLGNVELDVFQIQVVLVVLLHLQEVVELEIELEETPVASYNESQHVHALEKNVPRERSHPCNEEI